MSNKISWYLDRDHSLSRTATMLTVKGEKGQTIANLESQIAHILQNTVVKCDQMEGVVNGEPTFFFHFLPSVFASEAKRTVQSTGKRMPAMDVEELSTFMNRQNLRDSMPKSDAKKVEPKAGK